jgi:hypothetical protein
VVVYARGDGHACAVKEVQVCLARKDSAVRAEAGDVRVERFAILLLWGVLVLSLAQGGLAGSGYAERAKV